LVSDLHGSPQALHVVAVILWLWKVAKSLRIRNSEMILKTAPRNVTALLVVPATLWLLVFAVAPLLLLVAMSFWTSTIFGTTRELTLDNYRVIVSDPIYLRVLLQTLRIAATVTLISLLVSYPMAYFIASRTPKTKGMFLLLLFLPFWSSYVVRTFVWLPMLGRNGFVNVIMLKLGIISEPLDWLLYNEGTTHIALVYVYTLFMSLPIYLSLDRLDRSLIEAAADLGAGPFRAFYRVILPLTMPGVLSGCVMVFLLACGAYVTPQLLGGTSGIMFGNIIAPQYTVTNNWALGAALSVVLILVVFLCLVIFGRRVRLNDIFMGG
jgi:spermidine/putrescine transport system permease protein